jgi:hypothetical protein
MVLTAAASGIRGIPELLASSNSDDGSRPEKMTPEREARIAKIKAAIKRKPTTNPQIEGKPMSFVRLVSHIAGPVSYRQREFSDSQGVPYTRDSKGTVHRVRAD